MNKIQRYHTDWFDGFSYIIFFLWFINFKVESLVDIILLYYVLDRIAWIIELKSLFWLLLLEISEFVPYRTVSLNSEFFKFILSFSDTINKVLALLLFFFFFIFVDKFCVYLLNILLFLAGGQYTFKFRFLFTLLRLITFLYLLYYTIDRLIKNYWWGNIWDRLLKFTRPPLATLPIFILKIHFFSSLSLWFVTFQTLYLLYLLMMDVYMVLNIRIVDWGFYL